MKSLPLFFVSQGRRALLIGGGMQAEAKLRPLLEAGFEVHLVADVLVPNVERALTDAGAHYEIRHWQEVDLDQADLIIAADVSQQEAELLAQLASLRHIPINVVDRPSLCSVTFPARIQRGDVQLAVGTAGKATLLATILREEIEQLLPAGLGELAEALAQSKDRWQAALPKGAPRRDWLRSVWQEAKLGLPLQPQAVADWLQQRFPAERTQNGMVVLVGAGPGDPDLLTLKALRALQHADVIIYDRLVSPAILAMARADAERIYVGKNKGLHSLPQDQINTLLVEQAQAGKLVVRLKGGDPFIFGRGGEEVEELLAAGISCQVIPGITSASGCSAYCGIPLTHRDHAQSVTFITGHLQNINGNPQDSELNLPWTSLARPQQTVVFYMGLTALGAIVAGLLSGGMSQDTPVALIQQGTCPEQQLLLSTLAEVEADLQRQPLASPTLIIVGTVVTCAPQWETRKG
ncbi:uroporphyrinogen-III C-methyltransferase [Pokkaliibacter plantistimulans]|uniref:Uroporphyrinogen-III C-methyltransferase n=1 Tax=Proteobacteria bacterium 228 TaxID=2083153 RepID=A0A2S5KWW5_9PROT|nr:siroheme synthase CysG [Pokkaliibacter plantistimulans]PPC78989.1 uroporphyrinogen-III C-methyltransferase [Pokkaliibacter plantistimulans]